MGVVVGVGVVLAIAIITVRRCGLRRCKVDWWLLGVERRWG